MITLRPVTPEDLDLISTQRTAMFADSGKWTEAQLAPMEEGFRSWLAPQLADGRYFGFVAEAAGQPVGGIGLMILDWPPHPLHPDQGQRGYVLNMFVDPTHRRQGLARRLMAGAEAEFARRGVIYAILHATEAGRPLYEAAGWGATAEMAKVISGSEG